MHHERRLFIYVSSGGYPGTVTRLVLGTTVYEATVKEIGYDGTEVNEFTLKSDADGNTRFRGCSC